MQCSCGFENASDARFCGRCRSPLAMDSASNIAVSVAKDVSRATQSRSARISTRRLLLLIGVAAIISGPTYWWMNRPPGAYRPDNSGLFPVEVDGRYGFINKSGNALIQPQFDEVGSFSEGRAAVRIGLKVGYIDTAGKLVITPQFDPPAPREPFSLYEFRYGRARVRLGGRVGLIDDTGKYVRNPDLLQATRFSEGLSTVQTSTGEWGFLDRSGNLAKAGSFGNVFPLSGGLAGALSNGRWGYIDRSGKWIISPQFEAATNFYEGRALVRVAGQWGYIDQNGRFAINPQFELGSTFSEGLAAVRAEGRYRFIDLDGKSPFGGMFDAAANFSNGFAAVKTAEGWGYINKSGTFIVTPRFDEAEPFAGNLAMVTIGSRKLYIDTAGEYIGDPFKGRAVRPVERVREIWEGEVVAPQWKSHQKFLLLRNGNTINGFYVSDEPTSGVLGSLSEVRGDLKDDDTLRVVGDNGFVWKGRFVAPILISGVRPNGDEGQAPEFPFRLALVRDAAADDIPSPLSATSTDWSSFLARFTEAVKNRDEGVLAGMMGRTFELQNRGRLQSPADVFRQLNWSEVLKATNDGTRTEAKSPLGHRRELLTDGNPCSSCRYAVRLSFAEDEAGQWRWTGVTYPGD